MNRQFYKMADLPFLIGTQKEIMPKYLFAFRLICHYFIKMVKLLLSKKNQENEESHKIKQNLRRYEASYLMNTDAVISLTIISCKDS